MPKRKARDDEPGYTYASAFPNDELEQTGRAMATRNYQAETKLANRIGNTMTSWSRRPVDLNNPKAVKKRIKEYMAYCQDNQIEPNPIGLATWIGVKRTTMKAWANGKFGSTPGEQIIQEAFMLLEENWYQSLMENKQMIGAYAFIGKNWYGYKDSQDILVTPGKPLGEEPNQAELEKRIKAEVVIDVEPDEIIDVSTIEPSEVEPKV